MGLLDIWSDWKKDNTSYSDGFEDYTKTAGGTLDTAGGKEPMPNAIGTSLNRKDQKPSGQFDFNPFKEGKTNLPQFMLSDEAKKNQSALIQQQGTPKGEMMPVDKIDGNELSKDSGFMAKLSGMAGVDIKQASANWKEKGGFEGLMSNPAFSLGLALMQSSANGKTINQGILDNFVKSAKISAEFKDRIEARKQEPIQATAADMAETKDLLKQMNIEEGNWFENILSKATGGNPGLEWDTAVEEISLQYQKGIQEWQANNKDASGKPKIIRKTDKIKIMNDLVKSGKIKESKNWLNRLGITSGTLSKPLPKAKGGPVSQGQPYLVGEKGPEIIIPHSSGNVLSNDDSQIYSMLLASNPQLQKVSKQRAEKILRNRFPEYFEG